MTHSKCSTVENDTIKKPKECESVKKLFVYSVCKFSFLSFVPDISYEATCNCNLHNFIALLVKKLMKHNADEIWNFFHIKNYCKIERVNIVKLIISSAVYATLLTTCIS